MSALSPSVTMVVALPVPIGASICLNGVQILALEIERAQQKKPLIDLGRSIEGYHLLILTFHSRGLKELRSSNYFAKKFDHFIFTLSVLQQIYSDELCVSKILIVPFKR